MKPASEVFHSVENQNGGKVWVSNDEFSAEQVKELYNTLEEDITGTHGDPAGNMEACMEFFETDKAAFPNSRVVDYWDLVNADFPDEIPWDFVDIINGDGNIILQVL